MKYRVQWYETSSVPGNFGWADGRQRIVESLVVAEIMAEEMMNKGETRVSIDLIKEPGPGAIALGGRERNAPIAWTKRGAQMLKDERATIAERGRFEP